MLVAASPPTILSGVTDTDGCVLEGQSFNLTCEVTYNGTNLMPMNMQWKRYTCRSSYYGCRSNYQTLNAVNVSSVYHSSLIYTTYAASGQPMEFYTCSPRFSSPTGLAISGVQRQYSSVSYNTYRSPARVLQIAASKATLSW